MHRNDTRGHQRTVWRVPPRGCGSSSSEDSYFLWLQGAVSGEALSSLLCYSRRHTMVLKDARFLDTMEDPLTPFWGNGDGMGVGTTEGLESPGCTCPQHSLCSHCGTAMQPRASDYRALTPADAMLEPHIRV